jgi:hypothetical protein
MLLTTKLITCRLKTLLLESINHEVIVGFEVLTAVVMNVATLALYPRRWQYSCQVTDNYNYHIISLIRLIGITLPHQCIPQF